MITWRALSPPFKAPPFTSSSHQERYSCCRCIPYTRFRFIHLSSFPSNHLLLCSNCYWHWFIWTSKPSYTWQSTLCPRGNCQQNRLCCLLENLQEAKIFTKHKLDLAEVNIWVEDWGRYPRYTQLDVSTGSSVLPREKTGYNSPGYDVDWIVPYLHIFNLFTAFERKAATEARCSEEWKI